ncbi:MAG: LPS export ABC transporter periplasmic protein LptC [Betaproteobacteria bacterium]|nr:LPS export ABC transporter periplasmic protein LptC [Betaproteobacteria bacterium]MBI2508890.1 LPS export ABC transporter periplasmic protein LptC [Betaproteobacteria bacterium]
MSERLTAWVPLLLVGLLAALTFWLDRAVQSFARDVTGASRHDPDYIVDNLSAARMGEAGAAKYTLSAAKMVHYPDDDTTLLTTPRFVSHGPAKAPMIITASQAVVSGRGDHVYFQDDVRVTRTAYGDQGELVMRTTFLHVMPDLSIARTDRQVTITDAVTAVTAVGLELNSETRILKLLSSVRGTYDPGKAPKHEDKR